MYWANILEQIKILDILRRSAYIVESISQIADFLTSRRQTIFPDKRIRVSFVAIRIHFLK